MESRTNVKYKQLYQSFIIIIIMCLCYQIPGFNINLNYLFYKMK